MQSGFHEHYCPQCQKTFTCPKITHCNDPQKTMCVDCWWILQGNIPDPDKIRR